MLRALRDFALLVAAGAALFLLCVGRFRGERVVLALMGSVAAVLGIAGVGVQGVALLGYGNLFDAEVWRAGIRSSYGLSATVATAAALSIAAAAALRRGALRSSLLALGAFGIAVSLPLTGHAATANPRSLALIAITSHVLAAAFWTGSLVALLSLLRERSVNTVSALQRFSQLATWGVALLFAAGAAFAAMQLASPGELLHSRYGNLILGKTALFALLLALAAYNRFVLVAAMKHGGSRAVALRASITTEIAIIVAVVAVTAILTQTSPQAQQTVYPLSAVSHSGTMTVVPGRAGRNVIAVRFRDKDGKAFYPEEAVLDLANAAAGVEPITRPLIRSEQGDYRYEGRELAFAGRWSYEITMRINAFEQVDFTGSIEIE